MGILGDIQSLYKDAVNTVKVNARGFTPFQFSSRMTQVNTSQMGGLIPSNPISDLVNESIAWYEMWVNPQKLNLQREYIHKRQHTARSIVTYHYRPEVHKMRVSGVCGWIAINPQKDKDDRSLGFRTPDDWKKFYDFWDKDKVKMNPATSNSPRIFLERLRNIADESMYFVDLEGIEHYNIKYIKIYTKQYPDGMICEGYYTNFEIPEEGEDAQTINYSFEFIVERMMPVAELKEMLGMFSMGDTYTRKTLSSLPGII